MAVEFYKTLWGMSGSLEEKLVKIKGAGYEGFEDWVTTHSEMRPVIDRVGIKYIAMVPGDTADAFKRGLAEAYDCGAVSATIHVGRPWMTYEEGLAHLQTLVELTKEVPFPVNFETHRARLLYEPMSTAKYLTAIPDLYLCADLSHWTVVTGTMLGNFGPQMELVMSRTRHIHARIGFEEGPQVPDPRAKNWEAYVPYFEKWWDVIKGHADKAGRVMTVDPEFGPPNYQWSDPVTGKPLADIWDVALWMTERLRKRWA